MKKLNKIRLMGEQRVRPECSQYANFYLEQFFTYLSHVIARGSASETTGATGAAVSFSLNYSTNEEKIKEMFDKMSYSLCRCETPDFLRLVNHIFSILTACRYLAKSFYESFVLKKLEFEPIISEI